MNPLLESAWAKMKRANGHLGTFKTLADGFGEAKLKNVGTYLDAVTGDKVYQLDIPLQQPPPSFSPIIGDALFDYRSALDHLMWALVSVSGNTPDKRTQFPIFDNSEGFNDPGRGGRMWRGVTSVIKAALELEQPYDRQRRPGQRLLWLLHQLHRVDKHRHFNLVVSAHYGVYAQGEYIDAVRKALTDPKTVQRRGRVEQNTELVRIPQRHAAMNFHPTFDVAFGEGTDAPFEFVRHVLGGIDDYVGDILDDFEQRFFSTEKG